MRLLILAFLLSFSLHSQNLTPLFQTGNTVIKSIAVAPNGREIAVEGQNSDIAVWDLATRKKRISLKRQQIDTNNDRGGMNSVGVVAMGIYNKLSFSNDGQRLFLLHNEGITVWNPSKENPIIEFSALPDFCDISADCKYVAVVEAAIPKPKNYVNAVIYNSEFLSRNKIILYDTQDGMAKELTINGLSKVKRIRFIPNSTTIIIADTDGEIALLDFLSGQQKPLQAIYYDRSYSDSRYKIEDIPFQAPNTTIAVHPTNTILALMDSENKVYIYDFKEEKLLHSFQVDNLTDLYGPGMERFQFTPNGKYLVGQNLSISDQGFKKQIRFWSVETGKEVKSIVYDPSMSSISYSNDGKYISFSKMGFQDEKSSGLSILDAIDFQELINLQLFGAFVFFPNDSKRIAFVAGGGIGVYNLK